MVLSFLRHMGWRGKAVEVYCQSTYNYPIRHLHFLLRVFGILAGIGGICMNQETWTKVDQYINEVFVGSDPILEAVLQSSREAGLPEVQVYPAQGRLLAILARAIQARKILEIGTLGGYSAIWLSRTLPPGGQLITLEADPKHAEVARKNIARAGLEKAVEIRIGRALETLPELLHEGHGPFDLIFIDANRENYSKYLDWALRLTHSGSLIIADNVIRKGAVADADTTDERVLGVRRFNAALAGDPRVTATAIQTVGSKGYDGFAIALVN